MKFFKIRLITGLIMFAAANVATLLIQYCYNQFTQQQLPPDNLFGLCFSLGSFAVGFFHYYRYLIVDMRLTIQDYQKFLSKKMAFSCFYAYALGIICTIVFSLLTFFSHKSALLIAAKYGYSTTLSNIIAVTCQKTYSGFLTIAIQHYGLLVMIPCGAFVGYLLAVIKEKWQFNIEARAVS